MYKRGEIVSLGLTYSDRSSSKRRPVVVVSPTWHNDRDRDMLVVPLTSQLDVFGLSIDSDDLEIGVLAKPSVARIDKVYNVAQSVALKRIGTLNEGVMDEITARLVAFISGEEDFVEN